MKREHWFETFINENSNPSQNDIVTFHQFTGDDDMANNLLMKRENVYCTVSITSMLLTPTGGMMRYVDLKRPETHESSIEFRSSFELV